MYHQPSNCCWCCISSETQSESQEEKEKMKWNKKGVARKKECKIGKTKGMGK
jgi:hypothetical protein